MKYDCLIVDDEAMDKFESHKKTEDYRELDQI